MDFFHVSRSLEKLGECHDVWMKQTGFGLNPDDTGTIRKYGSQRMIQWKDVNLFSAILCGFFRTFRRTFFEFDLSGANK